MKILQIILMSLVMVMLGGCLKFNAVADPTRYYVLSSVMGGGCTDGGRVVGLKGVDVADYLDRKQMVRKIGCNEVVVEDFHLWAESFDGMLKRVLAEDLGGYLGEGYTVLAAPWSGSVKRDYEVYFRVNEFDVIENEGVVYLNGYYDVKDMHRGEIVDMREVRLYEGLEGGGYADVASAMSRVLGHVSEEIGDAVRGIL